MLEKCLQANERLDDDPLGLHLQALATCFVEDGYAEPTVRSKLRLLADLGRWLGRTGLAVCHLDERLVKAFVKQRRQVRRGDLRTLRQFLDHLRKRAVIPEQEPVRDLSPLADILSRYEEYLRSERGLRSQQGSVYWSVKTWRSAAISRRCSPNIPSTFHFRTALRSEWIECSAISTRCAVRWKPGVSSNSRPRRPN